MSKRILFLVFSLLALYANAQDISITGNVTDDTGEQLIGVSIQIKDSKTGVLTNIDGEYEIKAPTNGTLIFRYIGFDTQEISINSRTQINVKLQSKTFMADEVQIVVPYGVAKKSTFTGSAGVVESKAIGQAQSASISNALQGTLAGVQTFSASGQPGEDATIRIRGVGSINASNDPLYVVDGVPYNGTLSSIANSDIESVTVMKDAASATLYGSRAANGVVMITTKRGKADMAPEVEISSKFGFSNRAIKDYNVVNTNQNFELYWEALRNSYYDTELSTTTLTPAQLLASVNQKASNILVGNIGINPYGSNNPTPVGTDGKIANGLYPLWNDNWTDALTRTANYTDIGLTVRGGGKSSNYYFSGSFLNNEGFVIESGFKRYSLRANITSEIKKWLEIGLNVSGSHSIQDYPKQDDSDQSNVINFGRNVPSYYPIYERNLETGEYLDGKKTYDFGNYRGSSYNGYNLVATLPIDISQRKRDAATIRAYVQAKPINNLVLKTSLNVDYSDRTNHNYQNGKYGKPSYTGGYSSKSTQKTTGVTINNVATYNFEVNNLHQFQILAGQEYYEYNYDTFGGTRSNMLIPLDYTQPDMGAVLNDFYGYTDEYKMLSFFGSTNYSYDNRYYLSASIRTDGSSRFASENRWGTFWSIGGSWRIIDESFMKSLKENGVSNILLKSSYGAQGNDNIDSYYAYQSLLSVYNNLGTPGFSSINLANQNLKWESNLNFNVGLDLSFLNNRISAEVEYFQRQSKDLILNRNLAPSLGYSSVIDNIGKMKNYGWEFTVTGYPIHTEDWKLKLSINATTYKNKITELPYANTWSGNRKFVKGGSMYDYYLVEWAGVNPENGEPQWYKVNADGTKEKTSTYPSESINKVKAGSSLPKVSGGFSTTLNYKQFELSALFSYVIGGKIYNSDKVQLLNRGSAGANYSTDMLDRWTPENTNTDIPRMTTNPSSIWTSASTRFFVDRSFLRLKNVSLSYTLPSTLVRSLGLKNVNVFAQGENLFLLHKEQGLDPEQNFEGTTYYRYPAMRTISFGFNVKL